MQDKIRDQINEDSKANIDSLKDERDVARADGLRLAQQWVHEAQGAVATYEQDVPGVIKVVERLSKNPADRGDDIEATDGRRPHRILAGPNGDGIKADGEYVFD